MNNPEITVKELKEAVVEHMKKAKTSDLKWIYCYFNEFEEFPIVTDEYKGIPLEMQAVAEESEESGSVICPMDID